MYVCYHTVKLTIVFYCSQYDFSLIYMSYESDIDECQSGDFDCDDNAECSNTPGSYQCDCRAGYSGNGMICTDIDECLNDPCDMNATCTNTNGSYYCQCYSGFVGNGTVCTRKWILCFNHK